MTEIMPKKPRNNKPSKRRRAARRRARELNAIMVVKPDAPRPIPRWNGIENDGNLPNTLYNPEFWNK